MRLETEVKRSLGVILRGLILDCGGLMLLAETELVQKILMVEADIGRL